MENVHVGGGGAAATATNWTKNQSTCNWTTQFVRFVYIQNGSVQRKRLCVTRCDRKTKSVIIAGYCAYTHATAAAAAQISSTLIMINDALWLIIFHHYIMQALNGSAENLRQMQKELKMAFKMMSWWTCTNNLIRPHRRQTSDREICPDEVNSRTEIGE